MRQKRPVSIERVSGANRSGGSDVWGGGRLTFWGVPSGWGGPPHVWRVGPGRLGRPGRLEGPRIGGPSDVWGAPGRFGGALLQPSLKKELGGALNPKS